MSATQSPNDREVGRWSAGAVASRLGIAASTLRSWNHRYGVGPVPSRTGGHRLYSETDVAELQRIQQAVAAGMPVKAAVEIVRRERASDAASAQVDPPLPTPIRTPAGIDAAAQRLDYIALVRAFDAALAGDGVLRTWERLCRPALIRAGERAACGERMDVELVLARSLMAALHRLAPPWPRRPHRPLLLACAQDEWHSLPLEVLAGALAEREVATFCLGAAVTDTALLDAATQLRPPALVLSASRSETARPDILRRLAERVPVVLVAGPGWDGVVLPESVTPVHDIASALAAAERAATLRSASAPTVAGHHRARPPAT
ncbi:MAG: MerR family transcriptional regulator [Sporichthyaceae bacterium]